MSGTTLKLIPVYVTQEEKAQLAEEAKRKGLSVSNYFRTSVGLPLNLRGEKSHKAPKKAKNRYTSGK
ncbi:MAG: hypothetical protein K1Y36_28540 [Blastocatellia bacterium]|nr:hypothetical protein [Blastocatellia bacterium]